MKPNGAGASPELIEMSPDWHRALSDVQLAEYIRYQFLRYHEKEWDWDAPAQKRRRSSWDGGKDSFGVKHSSAWARIARMVREVDADPGLWVCAHFSGVCYAKQVSQTNTIPSIMPNRLHSAQSPGVYHQYCEHLPDIFRQSCEVAGGTIANRIRGTANLGMNADDQLFYVLCDEGYVSATPFFRHAFAANLQCQRAVERYLWLAALDYEAQQRMYDAALTAEPWCITEALRAATLEIRKHWGEFA